MTKSRYIARVSYSEEFKPSMDLFNEVILVDKKLEALYPKLKDKKQRFSVAIRELIKYYLKKRGPQSKEPLGEVIKE